MLSSTASSGESGSDTDPQTETSIDPPETDDAPEDVFRALGQSRRRLAAYFLLQTDAETDVREPARHVAAWENDEPVVDVTPEERRRVYTSLQQNHLPKLDDYGFIEYDEDRHPIESADDVETLASYMETVPGTKVPWCLFYLALGIFGAVTAALLGTGVLRVEGWMLAMVLAGLIDHASAALMQRSQVVWYARRSPRGNYRDVTIGGHRSAPTVHRLVRRTRGGT